MADNIPPPPAGYTLVAQPQAAAVTGAVPPPPPGYTLTTPQQQKRAAPVKTEEPRTFADLFKDGAKAWGEAVAGPLEAAASTVTGALAKPVSDIAGLAATAHDVATGSRDGDPEGFQRDVQERLTYQPRTDMGKATTAAIGAVGDATVGAVAHGAKDYYAGAARVLGAGDQVSEAIGRGAEELTKQAPNLLGARVAAEVPKARAASAKAASSAAEKAESYASKNGIDWSRLPAQLKSTLTTIAKDAGRLEKLDPKAIKRQALLQDLRIPIQTTRGKLTRDPVELRREGIVSQLTEGKPIRDLDVSANRDLQANLEALRGRVAGKRGGLHDPTDEDSAALGPSVREPTKGPADVGTTVQNALRSKAKSSKANYDALYKKARETEPNARVPAKPLYDALKENPDIQHLGFVRGWLDKAAEAQQRKTGSGERVPVEHVTLRELNDLRSKATALRAAPGSGPAGHYAGQLIESIDEAMEEVPAGAKAWKDAISAYKQHQRTYKDQEIIRDLVEGQGGDRGVQLEHTWGAIAKSSIEKIAQVKDALLSKEGSMTDRRQRMRAWRDLRAETVNRILEDARNVTSTDQTERQVLTAAALHKSMNALGRHRLQELLGEKNTDELYRILRAAKITKTDPAGRTVQSGTVPNALVMAERLLKHIPGGRYVVGAKQAIKDLGERGRAVAEVKEAQKTPLQIAAEESERRAARRNASMRRSQTTMRVLRGTPPGLGSATRNDSQNDQTF